MIRLFISERLKKIGRRSANLRRGRRIRQPILVAARPTLRMRIGFIFGLVMCGCFSAVAAGAQQQRPSLPTDPSAVLTMQGIQTAQLAETWLHSGDPRLQAWSAYVILRDHHGSLIPDLVKMVSEYDVAAWPIADGRRDPHDAMIAILDALIELRGPVLTADAARLYPEFPVQSLILLS